MKKRVVIFSCGIAFLLMNVIGCSYHYKSNNVQNEQELTETESTRWLDYEDYKSRLLENRVPIPDCQTNYESETEYLRDAEYKNLSFVSTDFISFPDCGEVSLLRQEEIVMTPQESWNMIEQWLNEIGKRDLVDMEKEVRVITSEVEWDESQEYPYYYPALADHMDLKNARGAFICTKDCHFMVCYDQADGKMTEYLGKDDLALRELDEYYTEDIVLEGTLPEISDQSYPLISGKLTIGEGAELLTNYFERGTVTKPADGVTVGVDEVSVFRLDDKAYGYCYDIHRIYKGIPVSRVEKSGFQLVGCPYLPSEDEKKVYIVDDTGVSAYQGTTECSPLTEIFTDNCILGVKEAASLLSEKLAVGLRMDVEEVALVYAPYDAEIMNSEIMLLPAWKFEGKNNTKGEKLVAYVDVLTGDLYYYTIPERHQVE